MRLIFGALVLHVMLVFDGIEKASGMQRLRIPDKGKEVYSLATSRPTRGSDPTYEYNPTVTAFNALGVDVPPDLQEAFHQQIIAGSHPSYHKPGKELQGEVVLDETMKLQNGRPAKKISNAYEKPVRKRGSGKEKSKPILRELTREEAKNMMEGDLRKLQGYRKPTRKSKGLVIQDGVSLDDRQPDFNPHSYDIPAQFQAQLQSPQQYQRLAQIQEEPSYDNRLPAFNSPYPHDSQAQYQGQLQSLQQNQHHAQLQLLQEYQRLAEIQEGPSYDHRLPGFNLPYPHDCPAQYQSQLQSPQQSQYHAELQLLQEAQHHAQLQSLQQAQHRAQLQPEHPYILQSQPEDSYIHQSQPQQQPPHFIEQPQPQQQQQPQFVQPQQNNFEDHDLVFIENPRSGFTNPHLESFIKNNPTGHSFSHYQSSHTHPYYQSDYPGDPRPGSHH